MDSFETSRGVDVSLPRQRHKHQTGANVRALRISSGLIGSSGVRGKARPKPVEEVAARGRELCQAAVVQEERVVLQ